MEEVEIVALGAAGDGITAGAEPRYVPFALPVERVRLLKAGGLPQIVSDPSPERVAPVCRHFGECGGCVAQHMSAQLYAGWKRDILVQSFRQRGLTCAIEALQPVPLQSRRRAVLTARRADGGRIVLGYHRRRSRDLFQLEECPVLRPEIVGLLPGLRAIAAAVGAREARITVVLTRSGCDVALEIAPAVDARAAAVVAGLAAQHRIARLTCNGETLAELAKPVLPLAQGLVPPPGAFLQATAEAQAGLTALVLAAVKGSRRVADLFCGVGTFAFPLAATARVMAIDSNSAAIAALTTAARHARGLKPVAAQVRDLFRNPLSVRELADFDAVVLDPPRAGARAQAEVLAQSPVATVIAVSCNPATLARDVRAMVDGGYAIERVTPVDQFLYAAELEAVAVLRRSR